MGYFPNGTAGLLYQEQYCRRCVHWRDDQGHGEGCPVWDLHVLYNHDQQKDETARAMLTRLIPREGVSNEQCRLFWGRP